MSAAAVARRRDRGAGRGASGRATNRDASRSPLTALGLLGEVVVVGVAVALLTVPLVTALPAAAAGGEHLRAHARGERDDVRSLLARLRRACRRPWGVPVAAGALLLVLVVDGGIVLLAPAGPPVPALAGLGAGALLLVVLLRAAAAWSPTASDVAGPPWRRLVAAAAARSLDDLSGSALLLLALGLAGVLVWMLPLFALLVGGLVVLAAVAVEQRADARARAGGA
ncbi:hypothetical protein [uncultured Pseudokineococcus sp.]|uniref:hypothetical protein n=1 Tax=uncultured Pseudokineococcus sp. TaxID=1642928 RepID=UPI00261A5149|nr:hypothetical protein [uncultured Pseudokineococcus sp.]